MRCIWQVAGPAKQYLAVLKVAGCCRGLARCIQLHMYCVTDVKAAVPRTRPVTKMLSTGMQHSFTPCSSSVFRFWPTTMRAIFLSLFICANAARIQTCSSNEGVSTHMS